MESQNNLSVFCRLCGLTKHLNHIKCKIDDQSLNIEKKLIDCCRWNSYSVNEQYPKHVCTECFDLLEKCWEFVETVAATQRKLADSFERDNYLMPKAKSPISITVDGGIGLIEEFPNYDNSFDGMEMDEVNDWFDDNSIYNDSNLSPEINQELLMDVKLQPIVLLERLKEPIIKHETIIEDESETTLNDETLKSFIANDIDFPKCLNAEDKNADGTVKGESIERLKLDDWSVYQHQCNECHLSFLNHSELAWHYKSDHSVVTLRYRCWLCSMSYTVRGKLLRHIAHKHIPHLDYWFVH